MRRILAAAMLVLGAADMVSPVRTFARPAFSRLRDLRQPQESTFPARVWGDEYFLGWETADGYTVVFNEKMGKWTYAEPAPDGGLAPSLDKVARDGPPEHVGPRLRPSGEALTRITKPRWNYARWSVRKPPEAAGTVSVPVALVNFSDTRTAFPASAVEERLFGTGVRSLADFYRENSYGRLNLVGGPAPLKWINTALPHDDAPKDMNRFVADVVGRMDEEVDFSAYDRNGDCFVDGLVIVHQGNDRQFSLAEGDLPSMVVHLTRTGYGPPGLVTRDACRSGGPLAVDVVAIVPETVGSDLLPVGVAVHEYGHVLGLPDLYDATYRSSGAGHWSSMAHGCENRGPESGSIPGDLPGHLDPWSKWYLGWVTPTPVAGDLPEETIAGAADAADVYRLIPGKTDSGEYFLVENRRRSGFDAGLPGEGLLVWHVDTNLLGPLFDADELNVNRFQCWPGGRCNLAAEHYAVGVVQADNQWHLEKGAPFGEEGDPYPGNGNVAFGGSTAPDNRLYDGRPSGAYVSGIGPPGATMEATLSVEQSPPAGSALINGGARYVKNPTVTLSLACADGDSGCQLYGLSNDGQTWPVQSDGYTTSKEWTLVGPDGAKAVHVRYLDVPGNMIEVIAPVVLDRSLPAASALPPGGLYPPLTVALACEDPLTACRLYYSADGSEPGESDDFAYRGEVSVAAETILRFFAVDQAGNRGPTRTERYRIRSPMEMGVRCSSGSATAPPEAEVFFVNRDCATAAVTRISFGLDDPFSGARLGQGERDVSLSVPAGDCLAGVPGVSPIHRLPLTEVNAVTAAGKRPPALAVKLEAVTDRGQVVSGECLFREK